MVSLILLERAAPLIVLAIPYFLSTAAAIEDPIPLQTCFDFTGRPLTNNTQCPGSNACCHYLHQCTDNRLCTQDNSPEYVNALCAVNPWTDCSNICQYGANSSGFLPRVIQCPDGTFCCDSDRKCCDKGKGIILDGKGNIVNPSKSQSSSSLPPTQTPPSSPSSSSSASSLSPPPPAGAAATTPNVTSFPTTTRTSTPTGSSPAAPSSSGPSLAVSVGIGVAVGFSVLSCLILLAIWLQKRRKNRANKEKPVAKDSQGTWPTDNVDLNNLGPQEMSHSPVPQQFELSNNSMRVELAGDVPPYAELYGSEIDSSMKKSPRGMI